MRHRSLSVNTESGDGEKSSGVSITVRIDAIYVQRERVCGRIIHNLSIEHEGM